MGFWGVLYWYAIYPLHKAIFNDLVQAIARDAQKFQNNQLMEEKSILGI
jgi:hypothetical protein